jgi:diguanylate cyclase (GGDEF)-like protein/hemerythrin-like metal-binding protein
MSKAALAHKYTPDACIEPGALDLIERFPLSLALLDERGRALVLNERFHQSFNTDILASDEIQGIIHAPSAGWTTLQLSNAKPHQLSIRAQMVDARCGRVLVLDDATDTFLLEKLDRLQEQVSELRRITSTDLLTGAWNRAHFERVVATEVERSRRFKQPVSLLFLDIDHFKRINDSYGHQAGDEVLRELVGVIRGTVRSIDSIFRWGGEEFAVLAGATGYRTSAVLAERIRMAVALHQFPTVGSVMVSLGVAEHIVGEATERWFRRVDEALYRAKNNGRNQTCIDEQGSSDIWSAESGAAIVRLVWQEAYECGEPTIDEQHRMLFEFANAAIDASFVVGGSSDAFLAAVETLMAHITVHFSYEEDVLNRLGYEESDHHRLAHATLLSQARELKASFVSGNGTIGALVEFLANKVVAQHLLIADRKFFPLFHTRQG